MVRLLIVSAVVCLSTLASAQSSSSGETKAATPQPSIWSETDIVRGVRVGVIKADFDAEFEFSAFGQTGSSKGEADTHLGVAVGYSDIGISRLGWIGLGTYTPFQDGDEAALRAEASLAYGVNPNIYFFGGLNMNKFIDGEKEIKDMDMAPGYQFGVGIQATRQFGVEMKHITTNNDGDLKASGIPIDVDLELSGLEISASATF